MVKAFESKYPGVKVEAYRASGHELTTRMMEEAKAKKMIVDAVETTEANLMFMREAFLLRPYYSPHFASYPDDAKEKASAVSIFRESRENRTSALPTIRNFSPSRRGKSVENSNETGHSEQWAR
jgi:ABC-type Fe3+ transport system substrate-binding protein